MRAVIPARRTALPVAANTLRENTGPAQRFLAPLLRLVETSDSLIAGSVGAFSLGGTRFHIPRLIFMGPRGGGDTVRLGIFAGLHGDDHTGPEAIGAFLQELESKSDVATGYHIYAYPICNPSGFASGKRHNAAGQDLTAHFWNGSDQPEAYYLEREMGVHHFHGVISLDSGDNSSPSFFFSGGQNSTLRVSPRRPRCRLVNHFRRTRSQKIATLPAFLPEPLNCVPHRSRSTSKFPGGIRAKPKSQPQSMRSGRSSIPTVACSRFSKIYDLPPFRAMQTEVD